MHPVDWLTLLAVLLSPLLAVQVTAFIERRRQSRERRLNIFRTLMGTRATGLSPDHVQALNMIDIEFYWKGKWKIYSDHKAEEVLRAWRIYLDHLSDKKSFTEESWAEKRIDLFIELLHKMAVSLGYDFDKVHIKRTSYFPQSYGDMEDDQHIIRKGLVALMKGEISLPLKVTSMPDDWDDEDRSQLPSASDNYDTSLQHNPR